MRLMPTKESKPFLKESIQIPVPSSETHYDGTVNHDEDKKSSDSEQFSHERL